MMDVIFIRGLSVETIVGVYPWEREVKQRLILDIEMAADIVPAAATDDLALTINYAAVADRVTDFVKHRGAHLIETLAEEIVNLVRAEFSVRWMRLTIAKPGAVPNALAVGVTIERGAR